MSDLVKRLRDYSFSLYTNTKKARTLDEAADRIEALEAALREIDAVAVQHQRGAVGKMQRIARRALQPPGGDHD